MPIVTIKDTKQSGHVVSIPKIHGLEVKTNIVDTKYTPAAALLTFVSGSQWTVDYFSQVIDNSDQLAGQDPSLNAAYQQYKVIRGLVLKVDSPLSWSQDDTTKNMTATGSAHVHSLVIANEGDMFVASVGDGREGIFQVKSSEKKSLFKDSVYYIEYELIYFADSENRKKEDLESKVILELHYLKDFLNYGQNPIVTTNEFNAIKELSVKYGELLASYLRWFFSREYSTLLLPGQEFKTYDHFLTQFLLSIVTTRDNENIKNIRRLNVQDDNLLNQPTLWDALLLKDKNILLNAVNKVGLTTTASFSDNPVLKSIHYTGIKLIVYPKDFNISHTVVNERLTKILVDTQLRTVPGINMDLSAVIYDTELDFRDTKVRNLASVTCDDYYVFSQNFYKDNPVGKTLLEILAMDYLDDKKIDPAVLLKLINTSGNWGGLEKFYYIPILLVLIKDIIRSI